MKNPQQVLSENYYAVRAALTNGLKKGQIAKQFGVKREDVSKFERKLNLVNHAR